MKHYYCPNCGTHHQVGAQIAGKVISGLVVSTLTGAATRSWQATLCLGLLAVAAGHLYDEYVGPSCPECNQLLVAVAPLLTE